MMIYRKRFCVEQQFSKACLERTNQAVTEKREGNGKRESYFMVTETYEHIIKSAFEFRFSSSRC